MKFDTKSFKKNIKFFILCIIALVLFLTVTIFSNLESKKLSKKDLTNNESNVTSLVINELMSSNKGTLADEFGKVYDYVELYNGNEKDIDLKNYGLSDQSGSVKWTLPDVTIEAKGYLVIYLSGKKQSGLYATFKLKSSGGETLSLYKPSGKVVDAVDTIALEGNSVMARDENGQWIIQSVGTPGYANTIDGHEEFLASLVSNEDQDIKINEILVNNKGNFLNENGQYSGYIEVINEGKKTINLANYSLSNTENASFKWQFPSVNINAGEVIVVFTSGVSSKSGELSTSFKLNNNNGSAILTNNKGKVIDKVQYSNIPNGVAYIKQDGSFYESSNLSAGYSNTVDGIKSFQKKYLSKVNDLIINEAMNLNYKYLSQNGGNYYDWVELYNNTNKTIKLSDYCLTTNLDNICTYKLPDVELKKGEYYVLMASGEESLSNSKYKHMNFKLSDTESIYLTKSNKVIDTLFMNNVPKGYSVGKGNDYGVYYFSTPTPNAKNGNGTMSISYAPKSSESGGIYEDVDSIKVTLSGVGKIYYTTNGSNPTTSSKVYSSPLTIKKTTVLKIMCKESDKLKSEVITHSFIVNEGHKLSVMSVSINPSDLSLLHSHAGTEGYIKQAYAEYFDKDGEGFTIGAGLKLFGGSTRWHSKKSYELKFKKQYGESELHYKVFDDVDSSVFNSLVIRSGSQDEMGNASKKTLIRDLVGTSLVSEYTNVDVQAYKPIVLYINGKYWGLYFIREKVDETFVANHYNVTATKKNTDILRINGSVKTGSAKKYNKMLSFIRNNSLSNSANYEKIKEQIDIENLCDYWIAETWATNNDMLNVRYFSNDDIDSGKWKFIFYDLDFAFYNVSTNYFSFSTSSGGMTVNHFSTFLLRNLMKNKEFKKTYLERLSYNLKNTWSTENFTNKIDEVIDEIGTDEIKRNLKRWNNISYSSWQNNIKYLKNYAKQRNKIIVSQAKSYFGLSSSEVKKYFGDVE